MFENQLHVLEDFKFIFFIHSVSLLIHHYYIFEFYPIMYRPSSVIPYPFPAYPCLRCEP